MKNPIRKRLPRELKSEAGKYIVIFLFMVMLISLVSAFLVADNSVTHAYYEGFQKYNLEYGHIAFDKEPGKDFLNQLADKSGVTFYDLRYIEQEMEENGANIRIYCDRETVNLECIMSGEIPASATEIALDRMYAQNAKVKIGDTITLNGKKYQVTGLIAVPDYSCLFEKNSDMMFDSINFGVAVMTKEGLESVESGHYVYNYAWKYDRDPKNDVEEKKRSDAMLDNLEEVLTDYDKSIIQAQVDDLVVKASDIAEGLSGDFETISKQLEEKIKTVAQEIAEEKIKNYVSSIPQEELYARYMQNPSFTQEELVAQIVSEVPEENWKPTGDELADKLGVDRAIYAKLMDKLETMEASEVSFEAIDVSELDLEEENPDDMDLFASAQLDDIKEVIALLGESGLGETGKLVKGIEEIEALINDGIDKDALLQVKDYLPRYANQAINFTGEDMGSDKAMFIIFDYIVIVILAFVFGVTTLNTISQEAGVIGTLRASGYTRDELIRHYMALPVLVTLMAAIVGNIMGYTFVKQMMIKVYYNSYSLCTYVTLWNAEAFIDTTVIPVILMFVINYWIIASKLKLSPLRFLRHDISKRGKKKAIRLNTKIPFMTRFRLRILFQNGPAYITLFAGIFFAGFVGVFGLMFKPLLIDYGKLVLETKLASYQYVLSEKEETSIAGAEKYCIESLDTTDERYMMDSVSVYGIEKDSKYVTTAIPEGKIILNNGMSNKFGLKTGDTLVLKDPYSSKTYTFEVAGTYTYDAAMSIFMNRDEYNEMFGKDEDYYTGYFSNVELTDLDSKNVYSVITEKDLMKITNQLLVSMGEFMNILTYFAIAMFLLLMFILTKQIIEKNAQSISMTKILGFTSGEIGGLYLVMTSLVVLASLLIMVPIIDVVMRLVFTKVLYLMMSGYIPYIISGSCYAKTIGMGIACYIFVSVILMVKINRIPKSDALKNVE